MIIKYIKRSGFEIIHTKEISRSDVDNFTYNPGGDHPFWGSEHPYTCAVVFDPKPLKMFVPLGQHWRFWKLQERDFEKKYYYKMFPNMDNRRLLIKNDVRVILNQIHPKYMRNESYLHSTDNFEEAMEYVQNCFPELQNSLIKRFSK